MKNFFLPCFVAALALLSQPAFSQSETDTASLGLAGDNLDLYAVLTLFQKSKTIEAFEKSLNDEKTGINNLDLDLDKKVDFIKIVTKKDSNAFTFILQVDVTKKETQDVALILVNKDKDDKISIQAVGDEDLYGKDYVIEPKGNSSVTANPGYTGENPVTVNIPATNTIVIQSPPIVQYVYSPAYVPYVPPYYYGYYPPWFGFATVMAVGIYRHNHYHYHGGYHGGHYGGSYRGGGNTVVINNGNRNQINHNSRNTSNTVANNRAKGSYGNGSANRPSNGMSSSNRPSNGMSSSNRPSNGFSSSSTRPSTQPSNRSSSGFSSSNRSSSNFSSGGGRNMSSGGGMRGGGGGGGRRR